MKKLILVLAGVTIIVTFCLAGMYYRSCNLASKTTVATSQTSQPTEQIEKPKASKTVTLELSGVKANFAP